MVGRFSDLSVYREIFSSSDFMKIAMGGLLIPIALLINQSGIVHNLSILPKPELLLQIILLLSIAVNGLPIILDAIKGVVQKKVNVDELVSIALIACMATGNFMEGAIVSFIMMAGSFIEEAVSSRARSSIESLLDMNPTKARVEREGNEVLLDIEQVQIGETVIVKSGETFPIDGILTAGSASVDESLLTGESFPVSKAIGDKLAAGAINTDGLIKMQVTLKGKDSTISKLIDLVHSAENEKIPSTRIVDKYATFFTPVILSISIIVMLITKDINRAITVLIVGCPCSFLLAGPVSTIAAVGRAARAGIMVRGGNALEQTARVESVYFDKTGTLTKGKPQIKEILAAEGYTEDEILALAYGLEAGSTHPIASAVIELAQSRNITPAQTENLKVIPGYGVSAIIDGKEAMITAGDMDQTEGFTVSDILWGETIVGTIQLFDPLKKGVKESIAQLRTHGLQKITLLSGDSHSSVKRAASEAGIEEFSYSMKPEQKLERVKEDRSSTMFVGDGMNDSPSLASATVGVCMGLKGTDMAIEASDIILMRDSISSLPFLIRLSRRMVKIIKIDLILSLSINLVSILLSGFGVLTPILGALSHNIGSILVVMLSSSIAFTREKTIE